MKTHGEIEAAICEGVSRFEQDYMGRGPKDILYPGRVANSPRRKEEIAGLIRDG